MTYFEATNAPNSILVGAGELTTHPEPVAGFQSPTSK